MSEQENGQRMMPVEGACILWLVLVGLVGVVLVVVFS